MSKTITNYLHYIAVIKLLYNPSAVMPFSRAFEVGNAFLQGKITLQPPPHPVIRLKLRPCLLICLIEGNEKDGVSSLKLQYIFFFHNLITICEVNVIFIVKF